MKNFILVILLIISLVRASAQRISLFDSDRDLSSSLVNFLYQDSHGYMWVATEEGLNCYDGNKFNIYRHNPGDNFTLCDNYVTSLFENKEGELYVCTRRGLQSYNHNTRDFGIRVKDYDGSDFTAMVSDAIINRNGEFWIVGDSIRILQFQPQQKTEDRRLALAPESVRGLSHIHCGICDKNGNIWLSREGQGLTCVTPDGHVKNFFGQSGDPSISCMVSGKDGLLYLGTTSHGLLRYNSENKSFDSLSPVITKEIKGMFVESNGEILLATDGSGIYVYDPSSGVTGFKPFGAGLISSQNSKTHNILRDTDGNIWISVFQTGVVMIPNYTNHFGYIGKESDKNNAIGENCVSSIFKDSEGILWVGADNDGIYSLNKDFSFRSHFNNELISVPMSIFEDSRKNLWVGTYLNGVGTIDRNTGIMKRIEMPLRSDLPANMCFSITEDRDHNVWLGMLNSGLIKYNIDENKASLDFPWREKIDPYIASLYYSGRTNSLYVGTYSGLQLVNNLSHTSAEVRQLLSDEIVHSIDENEDGVIWIGTTNGIVSYNPSSGEIKRFGVNDGLPSSTVYGVRCDGRYVWMSHNNGISRLDPQSLKIANFSVGDGLQGNEFYKNSVFRDLSGTIYFGGTGGVTYFNPKDISDPGRQWTPRIIDIYTHGLPLLGNSIPYEANKFRLGNDENTFSIEFGTKELGRPENVRFAYSLDGKAWEILPAGTYTVNFYNLDPGNHNLSFRTVDGFTESPIKTVNIAVAYPWFSAPLTIWGYVLVVLVLLWWLVTGYKNRMNNKERLIELQHSDQLNEARLRSYVNISHEIRTPMSLVISPLNKLIANDDNAERQREYKLILRNAKRVLRLIDELMDLRKIEKHQMKLNLKTTPLVPFIQDICDTFARAVADKKQTLDFTYSDSEISAEIDQANFDKILMNLVSNAVKYTPTGGKIHIALSANKDKIEIKISDTGIGISDKDKEKIFERFYQVKENSAGGTGVGLHLTHQLIILHGGNISVADNPEGRGTSFILQLPVRSHRVNTGESTGVQKEIEFKSENSHVEHLQNMKIPEGEQEENKKSSSSSPKLLIVEDDEEIKKYLVTELSHYYRIETSSNGKEALEIIFRNPPHIILSDIMMPMMNGFELTRQIKQNVNLNNIPVILLTALSQDEDNMKAILAGADSYITKPFNIEIVKGRLSSLLNRYRELKNRFSGAQNYDSEIDEIEMESADERLMRKVVAYINRNLTEPNLSVEKLASEIGMSRVHLHRKLKELTNQSPSDFIRNIRLRQAAQLLSQKKLSVAEVAYATGFSSASTFSSAFKRLYGVTPSLYEENNEE